MGGKDHPVATIFTQQSGTREILAPLLEAVPHQQAVKTPPRAGIREERCHTEWDQGKLGDNILTSKRAHEKKFDKKFHST